jgi:hypothetical protein
MICWLLKRNKCLFQVNLFGYLIEGHHYGGPSDDLTAQKDPLRDRFYKSFFVN